MSSAPSPPRDRAREAALALVFLSALLTVPALGSSARQRRFDASGLSPDATYWMESAQRFRYVRLLAGGGRLPDPDVEMQAPHGYSPYDDTVVQEHLYGAAARALGVPEDGLTRFVRALTRFVASLGALSAAALAFALTRRRDAALLAAFVWAAALPFAERGMGTVLYREDLAVPVLVLHLAALVAWARRPDGARALLCGALLGAALLCWKVVIFWVLVLGGVFAALGLSGLMPAGVLARGAAGIALPPSLLALLPLSLGRDGFLGSTPLLLLVALALGHALLPRSRLRASALAAAAFVALRQLLPGEHGYDHAWATILSRLRFLGEKPANPLLLPFHARHFWTGNYTGPDPRDLLRLWPGLALAALPGLEALRRWPSAGTGDEGPLRLPAALAALFAGRGPAPPLPPAARLVLVLVCAALVGLYGLFSKFQLLAGSALLMLAVLGFSAPWPRRQRVRGVVAALLATSVAQTWDRLPGADRALPPRPFAVDPVVVFPSGAMDQLARELPAVVPEGEAVLASFVVSPFILTYLHRPTVVHCFFEGDLMPRLERVIRAQFATEEELWRVARAYGARWYLHEAHHVLRNDRRMSLRYVAGAMGWPDRSALPRMSWAPEELRYFTLAWENGWFRLFRVEDGPRGEGEPGPRGTSSPLWSRALFRTFYGDPLLPGEKQTRDGRPPSDLLYAALRADVLRERAAHEAEPRGVLEAAARIAPFDPSLQRELERAGVRSGSSAALAAALEAGLAGAGPLPPGMEPAAMPLEGED